MSRQDRAIIPAQVNVVQPYLDRADIVIIGNGIAGLTAAVEARRHAPDKRIVMVTDQIHPTINTPALKQFAIAKLNREQLLAYPAGTERAERIHVVTARVEEIHANSRYVTMSGNRGFGYESLLIATGSSPQGLPSNIPGRNFDGVMTLHRLQDYLDLRRRIPEVSEAVVIGGGVHAIETVMGLLFWGIQTHWLIRGTTFMRGMLDEKASEIVLENIRHAGAKVHTETEVEGVVGRVGSVAGVITNHKEMIPCQLVLCCTGTQPQTSLAKKCSAELKNKRGIMVDDQLRTSVRNIYAAGDVAALRNPQTGTYEPRAQWYAASSQGRVAGAMMAGREDLAQQSLFGIHWHATHLGELSMLTVGDPLSKDEKVITLNDQNQSGYRRLTIMDNRLVGYLAVGNSQPDSLSIKHIIEEGLPINDIIKPLLKGKFDAKQFLTQQRSRVARGLVTAQKMSSLAADPMVQPALEDKTRLLPSLNETAMPRNPATTRLEPATPPQPLQPAAYQQPAYQPATYQQTAYQQPIAQPAAYQQTAYQQPIAPPPPPPRREEPVIPYVEEVSPFTGNLPAVSITPNTPIPSLPIRENTEDLSPFTGNLPVVSAVPNTPAPALARENTEDLSPFTGNLPAISARMDQEVSPFTGNLPVVPIRTVQEEVSPFTGNLPTAPTRAKESSLVPATASDWQTPPKKRNSLWNYTDDTTTAAKSENTQPQPERSNSRGLLSYSQNPYRAENKR